MNFETYSWWIRPRERDQTKIQGRVARKITRKMKLWSIIKTTSETMMIDSLKFPFVTKIFGLEPLKSSSGFRFQFLIKSMKPKRFIKRWFDCNEIFSRIFVTPLNQWFRFQLWNRLVRLVFLWLRISRFQLHEQHTHTHLNVISNRKGSNARIHFQPRNVIVGWNRKRIRRRHVFVASDCLSLAHRALSTNLYKQF